MVLLASLKTDWGRVRNDRDKPKAAVATRVQFTAHLD
jgi:hypothetical protein